jgi:hypothetical protein
VPQGANPLHSPSYQTVPQLLCSCVTEIGTHCSPTARAFSLLVVASLVCSLPLRNYQRSSAVLTRVGPLIEAATALQFRALNVPTQVCRFDNPPRSDQPVFLQDL